MVKKLFAALLSITMIACVLVSCKSAQAGELPEEGGSSYNYSDIVSKWKNNTFAAFTLTATTEYLQDDKKSEEQLSEIVYSQNDKTKVTSFYRRFNFDTINQSVTTKYVSDEYFDGKFFYYNQNGEKSYEEYLATDFVSNTRLCTANYIFNLSDKEIKGAKSEGDGKYSFDIKNADNYKEVVSNYLRLSDKFDINDVKITSLNIQMYTQGGVLNRYDIDVKFSAPDSVTGEAKAQINFISDSGEVIKPNNLSDYLNEYEKEDIQSTVESLFEDDKPADDYDEKKQEIYDKYGDAAEEIINEVEKEHNYTPVSSEPVSSTNKGTQSKDESRENSSTENVSSKPQSSQSVTSSESQTSSEDVSSADVSSENTSSEDTSSQAASSEDTSSTPSTTVSAIPDISSGGIDIEFID